MACSEHFRRGWGAHLQGERDRCPVPRRRDRRFAGRQRGAIRAPRFPDRCASGCGHRSCSWPHWVRRARRPTHRASNGSPGTPPTCSRGRAYRGYSRCRRRSRRTHRCTANRAAPRSNHRAPRGTVLSRAAETRGVITVSDLVVSYPRAARNAVDGVSFVAASGSLTALAGPNGSGKSSIVRALLGRADVVRGSVEVAGDDVTKLSLTELARRVAVVPQREEAAFPTRVREYVALGRSPHLGLWRAATSADAAAVSDALEQAGVTALSDRDTDALSGGEWQR